MTIDNTGLRSLRKSKQSENYDSVLVRVLHTTEWEGNVSLTVSVSVGNRPNS